MKGMTQLMKGKLDSIKYTLMHKKAFLKVEKKLLGKNTIRGYLHDLDKVILKIFLNEKTVHNLHRKYSRHHKNKACTYDDYVQMVIDWECARFTKPDKPLNARETLDKFYPELKDKVLPIIEELGL